MEQFPEPRAGDQIGQSRPNAHMIRANGEGLPMDTTTRAAELIGLNFRSSERSPDPATKRLVVRIWGEGARSGPRIPACKRHSRGVSGRNHPAHRCQRPPQPGRSRSYRVAAQDAGQSKESRGADVGTIGPAVARGARDRGRRRDLWRQRQSRSVAAAEHDGARRRVPRSICSTQKKAPAKSKPCLFASVTASPPDASRLAH